MDFMLLNQSPDVVVLLTTIHDFNRLVFYLVFCVVFSFVKFLVCLLFGSYWISY